MTTRLAFVLVMALSAIDATAEPGYHLVRRIAACCNAGDPTFAASVAVSPRGILVGIPGQVIGAAVLFDTNTGGLRGMLERPAPSRDFGRVVAATADVFAIAAPDVATVYLFDARTLALAGTLHDPAGDGALDQFGAALAIDPDHVVVGAPFDDRDGTDAGAAYVFDRRTGTLDRRLTNPGPFAGARFGSAVALAGDDAVVGASAEGASAAAGAVHVFSAHTGVLRWSRTAPIGAQDRLFGFAVDAAGRYLVVGAPCRDGEPRAGVAVLFDRMKGEALRTLAAPVPENCDFFGGAVAVAGGTIVVGARLAGDPDTGAVHVFSASTGVLRASFADGAPEAELGWSVALGGDRVVVGAAGEEGEVHVYARGND